MIQTPASGSLSLKSFRKDRTRRGSSWLYRQALLRKSSVSTESYLAASSVISDLIASISPPDNSNLHISYSFLSPWSFIDFVSGPIRNELLGIQLLSLDLRFNFRVRELRKYSQEFLIFMLLLLCQKIG